MVLVKLDHYMLKNANRPSLLPCTKLKSKCIKDLNIKSDTVNLIEEKVGNSLEHIGTGNDFLNRTLVAQALRSTINK